MIDRIHSISRQLITDPNRSVILYSATETDIFNFFDTAEIPILSSAARQELDSPVTFSEIKLPFIHFQMAKLQCLMGLELSFIKPFLEFFLTQLTKLTSVLY